MSKFVGIFSLLLMLWIFHGAKPALAETWYEFKSDNFIIYSNVKDNQIIKIAEDLEYFRYFLQSLTIVDDTSSVIPLEIYAYKNTRKFHKELNINYSTAGFYLYNFHGTFAFGDFAKVPVGSLTGREILFHEYVHFFMRQFSTIKYPRWYDEGFADYLATFSFTDGTVKIGNVVYNRVYSLKSGRWVPLEEVIGSDNWYKVAKENKTSQALIYAQAWFLVHYLSSDPERKEKLLKFLQGLDGGKPYDEAFKEIFNMPIKSLGMELKDYWNTGKIPYTLYNFKNIQFKPAIAVRELSDQEGEFIKLKAKSHRVPYGYKLAKFQKKAKKFIKKFPDAVEAQIILAEKLYFYGEDEEKQRSEEIISAVLKEAPDNSQANTIMGIIQFNKLNNTENQDEKDKYAFLGRKYLSKAVALDPLNVFAQYYLGFFYVFIESENPTPGINALGTALDLMPQLNSVEFHYALINARYGRLEEAAYFFKKSRKSGNIETWNKVADFCLSEIENKGKNHQCIFESLDKFEDD